MDAPSDLSGIGIARQVRQRLDSLRRAGVDRIPRAAPGGAGRIPEAASEIAEHQQALADSESEPALEAELQPPVAFEPVPLFESTASLFPNAEPSQLSDTLSPAERAKQLQLLERTVSCCVRCPILAATRTQTVFGEGNPAARLMFIGEAPGYDEDRTGRPFVGRAGQLLTDMITKGMGLKREDVYIANIIKCRPPDNRAPLADEIANCHSYLDRQIELVRPEFLCLLGKTAASALLDTMLAVGKLRGRWFTYKGIKTLVTYHPAYLLRNPESKRDAWEDLKKLMNEMGLRRPGR